MLDHAKLKVLADVAGGRWAVLDYLSASERSAARSVAFYAGYLASTTLVVPAEREDGRFHLACYLCSTLEPYAREGQKCPFGLSSNTLKCDCAPQLADS